MRRIADNCGSCGEEVITNELKPIKLGSSYLFNSIRICAECLKYCNPKQDFKDATELLISYLNKNGVR